MKKLLIFLSSISMVSPITLSVISCDTLKITNTAMDVLETFEKKWNNLINLSRAADEEIKHIFEGSTLKDDLNVFLESAKKSPKHQEYLIEKAQLFYELFQFWKFYPGFLVPEIPVMPFDKIEIFKDLIFNWGIWDIRTNANSDTIDKLTKIYIDTLNFDIEND
ncbi:lipoprotein [Spiroplasma endosymbiont of Panorpa germanica]|uniref:lipoprotein n=1 Tax=Spiroplasma endosymbiont of Panorpa germanica TaxID=3066314 RepID=UPI0030D1089A